MLVVGNAGHGGPQGVPARQRPEPDQPQRPVHGDHREHGGADGQAAVQPAPAARRHRRSAASADDRGRDRASPDGARHAHRGGLREARAEGTVRTARRGGRRRARSARPSACAPRSRSWARRSRSSARCCRRAPTCCRPSSSRSSRRCRTTCTPLTEEQVVEVMEQELGVPVGGRVRDDRPASRSRPARSPRCTARRSRPARRSS